MVTILCAVEGQRQRETLRVTVCDISLITVPCNVSGINVILNKPFQLCTAKLKANVC